jgi:hypothetical protein
MPVAGGRYQEKRDGKGEVQDEEGAEQLREATY